MSRQHTKRLLVASLLAITLAFGLALAPNPQTAMLKAPPTRSSSIAMLKAPPTRSSSMAMLKAPPTRV